MKRWPHRQISGINRALVDLESQHDAAKGGEGVASVVEELCELHRKREVIIEVRARVSRKYNVCTVHSYYPLLVVWLIFLVKEFDLFACALGRAKCNYSTRAHIIG